VLLLTEIPTSQEPEVPERIAQRKVIVYKSRVDPTIVKLTAEKMKSKLFVKFGFSKPRPEEIRVVSVDRSYEPYVLIDASYSIDYYKKKVYALDIDSETEEIRILGTTFKPETEVSPTGESRKVIKLEAEECLSYEDKAYVIFDKTGREVPPDEVPSAPSEDHPRKKLKEVGKKMGRLKFSPRKAVEMVKARLVKRPPDADRVENELFQISEHAVIYSPFYDITFRNVKTGEDKIIRIDGVSAKILQ
jgi:hypothetical protein